MTTLLILYLFFGALLVVLSIPLLLEKIKPNGWYGFRVPTTLENPEIWYAVNRHSAKRILISGVAVILAAILLYLIPGITLDQYAMGVLIVLVVVFGTGMIQSVRFMKNLARNSAANIEENQ
jgi:UPF0716 family protein affecting phage T7 exclusion